MFPGNIKIKDKDYDANNITLTDEISFAPIDENQKDLIKCDLKIICSVSEF